MKCVFEPAERSLPCDEAKQVIGNLPVVDHKAESLHDGIFVNIISAGKWNIVAGIISGQELGSPGRLSNGASLSAA
jgi:hypothetical protein